MKVVKKRALLIASIAAALAFVFQIIGLIRYIGRLPDDWVGIVLYSITIIAFACASLGFYIQWNRHK
jgi:tellurite resistance protein TehA-like permease